MADRSLTSMFGASRRAVIFELRLYVSLVRWISRHPNVPRDGSAEPFGYAQLATPVMWLWIFGSAGEVPIAHLLIPWEGVRIAALILGVWGVLWMTGYLASLNVNPHLLSRDGIRLRQGASVDIQLPWAVIDSVKLERRDLPSSIRSIQPRETDIGTDLQIGVSGEVNVRLELVRPTTVTVRNQEYTCTQLSFLVDDSRALMARIRELTSAVSR